MTAKLPNIDLLIQAGINPKTGLPLRMDIFNKTTKADIKKFLRIIDEQDAVNRYVWYNLPCNITSQELERLLYYKGQLCFFYYKELDMFFFMPYALDGTIDFYGRYNRVHPVPMTSGTEGGDKDYKERSKALESLLSDIKLNCVYGMKLPEEIDEEAFTKSCVLLHDYTKQLSQLIIPRVTVNDAVLDVMAECVPFMRTALIASTGVKGVRVNDADQADAVDAASRTLEKSALSGQPYAPIIGNVEMQEIANNPTGKADEYILAMQSLDNLRLSGYGIDNGGLFEKKAHELEAEAKINGGPIGLVYEDGLSIRQNFCNIVNSIWGVGIWCEAAEEIVEVDTDGDGLAYQRDEDGSQTGTETNEGGQDNE